MTLFDPELIICPFLRERVPSEVWRRYRTIIVHPGPMGDRRRSSLDWAIMTGETRWGATALQAVEEMDAGPIWATRTVPFGSASARKSAVYSGPIADAAIELIIEEAVQLARSGDHPGLLARKPTATPARLARHRPAPSPTIQHDAARFAS